MKIDHEALKDLQPNQEKVLASDIRSDILSSASLHGGHLSSNLGAVELTLSLLKAFDPYEDDILFDVGHQTYAYKILTGRSLATLRQYHGTAPFSDPEESKADKYLNGHASTAVSVAYGMALAKAISKDESYTVAVVGDSSLSSGITMEALGLLSDDHKTPLIIVINDNGMSIGKDVSFVGREFRKLRNSRFYFRTSNFLGKAMSKSKATWKLFLRLRSLKDRIRQALISPTVFESMGIKYIGPYDGHDFESLDLAFKKAKSSVRNGPVIVHVITKKGYGYPPAMKDEKGEFHGVSKSFDEEKPSSSDSFTAYKRVLLEEKMAQDEKAFVICPAMVYGSDLESVFKAYPERTLDVGIAEENAVTLASGLALKGFHPVVDIYSTFLQRSYDEVFEDIARERCDNLFLIERAGLVGEDGSSHQGLYDVAFLKSIPGTRIVMPYDKASLERLFGAHWFSKKRPTFIRFPKDAPQNDHPPVLVDGSFDVIEKKGMDVLFLATGPNGMKAALLFDEKMAMDKAMLTDLLPTKEEIVRFGLLDYRTIYFYDAYSTLEGSAGHISALLLSLGYKGRFVPYAFKTEFVPHGSLKDLYDGYSLSPEKVIEAVSNDFAAETEKDKRD